MGKRKTLFLLTTKRLQQKYLRRIGLHQFAEEKLKMEVNPVVHKYREIATKIAKEIKGKRRGGFIRCEETWESAVSAESDLEDVKKDIQGLLRFLRENAIMPKMIYWLDKYGLFKFMKAKLD